MEEIETFSFNGCCGLREKPRRYGYMGALLPTTLSTLPSCWSPAARSDPLAQSMMTQRSTALGVVPPRCVMRRTLCTPRGCYLLCGAYPLCTLRVQQKANGVDRRDQFSTTWKDGNFPGHTGE